MKAVLFFVCILLVTNVFAQDNYLSISNTETGKEVVFKQNKRVRVKTMQGGKLNGPLLIVDNNHVMIKNTIIPISNIERIKNNPVFLNAVVSGTLFIIGGYGILGGVGLIIWGASELGLIAIVIGAGSITGGILAPNFLSATRIYKNSTIKVVTLE